MLSVLRSFVRTDFDYSPYHRLIEIVAIIAALSLMGLVAVRSAIGFATIGWGTALWVTPLAAVLGYLMADFASGFVHWLGDTYGSEQTPVLGESFIKPFRDHHVEPQGILEHDFVEVNGNNSIVLALFLLPVVLILTDPISPVQLFGLTTMCVFTAGVFMTNQFHKWSHMDEPPAYAKKLQDWGLILGRRHHDVHHTSPFDTYYCITCGWLNPLLQRIQFFETIERIVRRIFGVPTARDKQQTT